MGDDGGTLRGHASSVGGGKGVHRLLHPCLHFLAGYGFARAAVVVGVTSDETWRVLSCPCRSGPEPAASAGRAVPRRAVLDLFGSSSPTGDVISLPAAEISPQEVLRELLELPESTPPGTVSIGFRAGLRDGHWGGIVTWAEGDAASTSGTAALGLCLDQLAAGCDLLDQAREIEEGATAGNGAAIERALAQRDELFEGAPEAMALVSNDGRVLRVNRRFTELFGYTMVDAAGEPIDRLLAPDELQEEAQGTTARVFQGEDIVLDTVRRAKDGRAVHVSVLGTPVHFHGGRVAGYAIYRDIGEQKAAEEALRQSEQRYRSIFASTTDAVLVFDHEGRIAEANPQAEMMYGYAPGELVGVHASHIIHPDRFHGFRALERAVRREGRLTRDSINVRKDGTAFDVEVHGAACELGGRPHLLAVVRDISQRVAAERALEQTRHRIERLHEAAHALAACSEEKAVYALAIDAAERILSFNLCSVLIEEDGWLVYRAVTKQYEASLPARLPLGENGGVAARTFSSKETSVFEDLRSVPEARPFHPGFISGISVPVGDVGVLQAVSTGLGEFSPQDARLAELLAGHVAETIRRLRLEAELRDQAMRDPLTGVYNRRHFNRVLEQEITRGTRYEHPLAFLMIDIDRFKEINDTRGHQVGDRVLREVAGILQSTVREVDTVVRYGGDEFLIVLPETGDDAEIVGQRIQAAVAAWSEAGGEALAGFPLTISIGSARLRPGEERPIEVVLADTDRRMYEAKRDRVGAPSGTGRSPVSRDR